MPIPDNDLAYLREMRALATDAQGRQVLVGLTFEETEEIMQYVTDRMNPSLTPFDYAISGDRYLELHDKHEAHRLAVVMAESESRRHLGTRH